MSDRTQRIEVFNDTQDWIKNDPALSASIDVAKKNTTVFYEDDYPAFDSSKTRDTVITVSGIPWNMRHNRSDAPKQR